jgi:hypothetical protein
MQGSEVPTSMAMINTRPAYRLLYKRLRLPREGVHGFISGARRLLLREQVARRREAARRLGPAPQAGGLALDPATGYLDLTPASIPGCADATTYAQSLLQAYQDSGAAAEALQRNPAKRFLLSVVSGNEFAAHPTLLALMLDRGLLDAATRYLGTVPRLEGAALWWTPPNDTVTSSQAWHIDELAQRQVKIILNCVDVGPEQGPLHYLPADVSQRLRRAVGHRRGRLADEDVARHAPPDAVRSAAGPVGSGVMFDSSQCLHFGSRGNRRDRLVLTFHYLPIDAPTETRYHLDLAQAPAGVAELDEIQRLALCLD